MRVSEIVSFTDDCTGAQFLRNINIRKKPIHLIGILYQLIIF